MLDDRGAAPRHRSAIRGMAALILAGALSGCALLRAPSATLHAPADLAATQGSYADRVHLTWSAVEGAAVYRLHRAGSEDGDYALLAETDATSYDDQDVGLGESYWYKVQACAAGDDCGPFSAAVSGYADEVIVPTGLTATYGSHANRITVRWDDFPGAEHYELEVRDEGGALTGELRQVDAATTRYSHYYRHAEPVGEPRPEHEYTYRVRAVDDGGEPTGWSAPVVGLRSGEPARAVLDEELEVSVDRADENDDENDQDRWTVTVAWSWTWHPATNPNPAGEFVILRRRLPDGAYAPVGTYAGPGEDDYDPTDLPYESPDELEPDEDEFTQAYTFTWDDDDEDLEEGDSYAYTIDTYPYHAGGSVRAVAAVEVVVEDG